jgi:hypothetical protein
MSQRYGDLLAKAEEALGNVFDETTDRSERDAVLEAMETVRGIRIRLASNGTVSHPVDRSMTGAQR